MMWIGLAVGGLLGAGLWGWRGAVTLGFVGWLVGLVVRAQRESGTRPAPSRAAPRAEPLERRVERLERELARLSLEVSALRGSEAAIRPGEAPEPGRAVATPPEPVAPEPVAPEPVAPEPVAPEPVAPVPAEWSWQAPVPGADRAPEPPSRPHPVLAWLGGGNAIGRIGLLILFFGLAFLLKYAADRDLVPIELRVAGVAAVGVVLLVLGWKLRERRAGYALGLQGAGVGVLYLTTFAALRLYQLIPPGLAFVLLAALAVLSAILAVAQDALILAAFGAGGGFLAPVLASTGAGSHVALFSYYLMLNFGIVAVAFFKAWRPLNVMGFVFTFLIGLAWGMRYYRPEHFATVEPFLVAFFVLYVAIAVLFTRRAAPELRHFIDATVVFGVPLAAFGLQAALVHGMPFVLAYSCLLAAAMYLALGAWLRRRGTRQAMLGDAFLALALGFATLAIPLALDARWTSAAWAVEGAAVLWVGIRQDHRPARAFGMLLQVAAGCAFVLAYPRLASTVPLVDAGFVGALLLAFAGIATSRLLSRAVRLGVPGPSFAAPAFLWGLAWWLFAGAHEIHAFVAWHHSVPAMVGFLAGTALASGLAARRIPAWGEAAWPALAFVPVLAACLAIAFLGQSHPFAEGGWLAWIAASVVVTWLLRVDGPRSPAGYLESLHLGSALLVCALGAIELHWAAAEYTARGTAWSVGAVVVVPALWMLAVSAPAMDARWPVSPHAGAHRGGVAIVLAWAFALWSLFANVTHDGRSDPLPYLPLLNALDLAHGLVVVALAAAWRAAVRSDLAPAAAVASPAVRIVAGAVAFVWLNGVLLRTIHHWAAVPYRLEPMLRSVLVQAALSIFWTALALALMLFAVRRASRAVWMIGAALMGVVVVKLFVVDLSHVGGIERVVSFIGVGVLMLAVGWLAPVPPRHAQVRA